MKKSRQKGRLNTRNDGRGRRVNRRVVLGILACRIRAAGVSPRATRAALSVENELRFEKPLPKDAITEIVRGIRTRAPERRDAGAWPAAPSDEIYRGPIGDLIRLVQPHTEADPVAIVAQMLTVFGNMVGRGPYFRVDSTAHHLNLFTTIVGQSAKAKKGSSWGHCARIASLIDRDWNKTSVQTDLASGEGLVSTLASFRAGEGDTGGVGTGPSALFLEKEFGRMLKVSKRPGNTLNSTLCKLWDGDRVANITKKEHIVVERAHASLIGHITLHEVRKEVTAGSASTGLGNRILWIAARKSHDVPTGGSLSPNDYGPVAKKFADRLRFARKVRLMRRTPNADKLWVKLYKELDQAEFGIVEDLTSRVHPQVLRIACLYAILTESDTIRTQDLHAAVALWTYARESVRYIFGHAYAALCDEILAALRGCDGMTRTELRDFFGRNRDPKVLDQVLSDLAQRGLVVSKVERSTGGRPAMFWKAVKAA